jgi:hypothetical protein
LSSSIGKTNVLSGSHYGLAAILEKINESTKNISGLMPSPNKLKKQSIFFSVGRNIFWRETIWREIIWREIIWLDFSLFGCFVYFKCGDIFLKTETL